MEPNFETRSINLTYMDPDFPVSYDEFVAFGWEQVGAVRRGFSEYAILSRDKNMPHYKRIAELDNQYFALRDSKKAYHGRIVFTTLLVYLILFVIPGFIYIGYKIYRKKEANKYNEAIQTQMDAIKDEAQKLLEESLAIIQEKENKTLKNKEETSIENP